MRYTNLWTRPRKDRFVRDNQRPDAPSDHEGDGDENGATASASVGGKPASFGELLCRIPEETLFQLQQIYEALEESVGGGNGGSRRKSTSSVPSLTTLIASPSAAAGGRIEDEQTGHNDVDDASVRTPGKKSKVCMICLCVPLWNNIWHLCVTVPPPPARYALWLANPWMNFDTDCRSSFHVKCTMPIGWLKSCPDRTADWAPAITPNFMRTFLLLLLIPISIYYVHLVYCTLTLYTYLYPSAW